MGEVDHDEISAWKDNIFPAFDLNMRIIMFGNSETRISTLTFEVRCHPDNTNVIKIILSRISSNEKSPPSEEIIYFFSYGLVIFRVLPSLDHHEQ